MSISMSISISISISLSMSMLVSIKIVTQLSASISMSMSMSMSISTVHCLISTVWSGSVRLDEPSLISNSNYPAVISDKYHAVISYKQSLFFYYNPI